jgi:hypothetical protein
MVRRRIDSISTNIAPAGASFLLIFQFSLKALVVVFEQTLSISDR